MNMMKDLLFMSLRQKAEKVNWEELGANASYLPLIYFVVMAPGFLTLMGISCLLTAAVGEFSLASDFPVGFFIMLGTSLIGLSLVLMITYRIIIKHQFKLKKKLSLKTPTEKIPPTAMDHLISPFLKQLLEERELFLRKID